MIVRTMDMVFKELQQAIALLFFQLREPSHEAEIYVERFEACNGVCADSGVMSVNWRTVGLATPGIDYGLVYDM